MSTSATPFLLIAELSGDFSSSSTSLASAVLPESSPLFSTGGLLEGQYASLSNAAQASQSFSGAVDSARFSLAPNASNDTGLCTLSGKSILLSDWVPSPDGLTFTLIGREDGSEKPAIALIYQLNIDPTSKKPVGYTLTTALFDVPIKHEGANHELAQMNQLVQLEIKRDLLFNDFSKAPSGQNDYIALAPTGNAGVQADGKSYHIVLTAGTAGTTQVNTSTTGVGVSDQAIDPGEMIRADFLTNITAGDSKDLTTLKAGARYSLDSSSFTISQVSPTKSKASARIELVNESITNPNFTTTYTTTATAQSELVDWSSFQVWNSGNLVAEGFASSMTITSKRITLIKSSTSTSTKTKTTTTSSGTDANTLVLGGLIAGDRVVVKGASSFNRLEVSNSGSYSFDIGSFGGTQVMSTASTLEAPTIKDATPVLKINVVAEAPDVKAEETALGTAVEVPFVDCFDPVVSGGADGIQSTSTSYSLVLSGNGVDSGLIDTATDSAVFLHLINGVVEGRLGSEAGDLAGTVVFEVSVNGDGKVSLTQHRALLHGASGELNESLTLAANLIRLRCTKTVEDGDGDVATAATSIDISGALRFIDDTPSLSFTPVTTPLPALEVSETALGTADTPTDTDNFAAWFKATITPGADGEGSSSASYSLSLANDGAASGLFDTATGTAVLLYSKSPGVVEGRLRSTPEGLAGPVVFEVSVNGDGDVSLTQYRALRHGAPGSASDTSDQLLSLVDGLIQLSCTKTVIDGDGDSATATTSIDIGTALRFADDTPSGLSITSTWLSFLKDASVRGSLSLNTGADGFGGFDANSVVLPEDITLGDKSVITSQVSASGPGSLTISGFIKSTIGTASPSEFYRLLLDQSGYSFSLLQEPPAVPQKLDFSSVSAGGPKETLTANNVTVNGYLYDPAKITNAATLDTSKLQLNLSSSDDDINPNNAGGIGVGNGNMDRGEGLLISCDDPVVGYKMAVTGVGGGIGDVTFWWQAFGDKGKVAGATVLKLGSGRVETLEINSSDPLKQLYVYTTGMDANDVFRINGITRMTYVANPDYQLGFQVAAVDGDGDRTALAVFNIGLDGNGDGQVTNPLVF